jgi:hypothetical protein
VSNNTISAVGYDVCGPPAREPVNQINSSDVAVSGNTTVGH